MLLTWGPVVKLRNIARSMGLTRAIAKMRGPSNYEERFDNAMFGSIRAGDTVWDIGANIGFYTDKFSAAVGERGRVVAFEPVPGCFEQLSAKVAGRGNVRLINAGLGSQSGTVTFDIGDGSVHPNARIVDAGATARGKSLQLPIHTGDDVLSKLGAPAPNVAKVDVEGFELDVLRGMTSVLRSPGCRDVFVEVHFGLLADRGQSKAPDEIVKLLREMGYTVRWVDASHVHASRGGV
ncbi:MAG TPA: FkbM family methyltransferase [Phycisphaerales bacterium]|nr:FkbM family methyltransferase [Phycisphaerales bacterium]